MLEARSQQKFTSIQDLALRVPELRKSDLTLMAKIGALNSLGDVTHRRDALWQVEYAGRPAGPLFNDSGGRRLSVALAADDTRRAPGRRFLRHRSHRRQASHGVSSRKLHRMGIRAAADLATLRNGPTVRAAGCVIARQRPGTAKGFVFLSLEDETGIANAILTPAVYEQFKQAVVYENFLLIEGELQNQENVISIKARTIRPLAISAAEVRSHDFH